MSTSKKNTTNQNPTVSIIIPVYNKVEYTKKCIDSIFSCSDKTNYEIIVVNNASTDGTEEYLNSVSKLIFINNKENLGFVEACNKGASKSRAKYLLFLNNDTEVTNNWLSSSIKIMDEDEKCGVIGSKLIFPNGKLQEAGAIIFSDANGWNFGYNENPELPVYNEITEVDYCSGASLMIKNDLFKELNGFDILYAPAYYEDSDLCFRVRKLNYKVIYNPNSVVVHHESVTSGKDLNSGFKKYLDINRQKFYDRWKEELKYHQTHPNISGIKPITANRIFLHNIFLPTNNFQYSEQNVKYAIMFFPQNPIPPVTGAHQRFLSMMDVMHKLGYKIIFFSTTLFGNYLWDRKSIAFLSKTYDAEVIVYSGFNADLEFMTKEEGKETSKFNWKKYNPPGLITTFQELVKRIKPSITFINYAYWAKLIENNQIEFGTKLIDMHDLVTLNTQMRDYLLGKLGNTQNRFSSISSEILEIDFFKNRNFNTEDEEYNLYNNFDILFSISEKEAKLVEENTSNVKVVKAPMTFTSFKNKNNYNGKVLFIIGDNPFNIQGYYYFAYKILPIIKKSIPNFKLFAIGDACKNVEKVDGIELLGRIDDLEVMYESARFSICPLIGQTGMSVKIVESMAHGVSVIALSNSAINSPIEHKKNGLIANNSEEFANYLIQLIQNNNLCKKYGKAARKTIKETFSSFKLKVIVENVINGFTKNNKNEITTYNNYINEKSWIENIRSKNQSRFAIVLVEHFGDIVACEPVARFIKANFPNSFITWYVKDEYKELVTANPNIDEIYTVSSLDEWTTLRNDIVDTEIIDLHVNNKICSTKGSILIKKDGLLEINANNYYFYGPLLTTFSMAAGLPPLNAQPKLYIHEYAKHRADELSLPKDYIVFHCSSNETERDWSKNSWMQLALYIIKNMNLAIIEVGSSALLSELSNSYSNSYHNYCGKLSLLETSEIIKRANIFVGIDSGPAHLANAVNTYGIILLGHYRKFKKYLPYTGGYGDGSNANIIYNLNGPASDISTNKVINSIEKRIGGNKTVIEENQLLDNITTEKLTRLIAFYLPQFHPIPENDKWWGKGFTEWKNVTKAKPLFDGHYQPHLPSDLGYYDLRLPETRKAQADLAREYGIEGFCYWHYWFNGKRLLERPFNDVLSSKEPDFPFCLAWANENWTKRWDGMDSEILQEQTYGGAEDDEAHFNWLLSAFLDKRYIRIENKPVFLVYNPLDLPNPVKTIALWQKFAKQSGLEGIYIIAIKSTTKSRKYNWKEKGFDAELLFQPNWEKVEKSYYVSGNESIVENFDSKRTNKSFVTNYDDIWSMLASDSLENEDTFSSVIPMWDNSARKAKGGVILHNSTPSSYEKWLKLEIERVQKRPDDKKLVFLNAWNEWAEGNHLEPDTKYGRGYLTATKKALSEKFSTKEKIEVMIEIAFGSLRIGDENNYIKYLDLAKTVNPNEKNNQLIDSLIQKKHSKLVSQKGVLAFLENNFEDAHSLFTEAIALDNNNLVAKRNLAQLYLSTNNLSDSFRICNQILSKMYGDKVALYLLAKTYQKNKQIDKSILLFKKLILLSKDNLQLIQKIQNELLTDKLVEITPDETLSNADSGKKLISIILVTYNQIDYTKQCIESLQKTILTNYEIIIVDNASSDNTISELSKHDNIMIIENKENLGFPKAVNQGINKANGNFILLINNDTIATENWLDRMLGIANQHPEVGIVGPISNSVSGRQLDKNAKYESIEEMHKYAAKIGKENKGQFFEFPRVAFLCTLIKKEVIDKIGGLDERFSPGNFEDDDFCLRAQMAGYKTVIATDVFIHHYGSVSFKADGEDKYAKRLEINRQKFIEKWGGDPEDIWIKGQKPKQREIKYSINSDMFTQYIERSFTNIEENELSLAIDNLEIALKHFKTSERKGYENLVFDELIVILGNLYIASNNLEKAKESFEKALNENPNSSTACQGLGEIFEKIEEHEPAKMMFEWAVKNDKTNDVAKQKLIALNKFLGLDENDFSLSEES